jgi:hypothetical protein
MVNRGASEHHQSTAQQKKSRKKLYDLFSGSQVITYQHTDKYGQALMMERTESFQTLLPVKLRGIIPQENIT